MKVTVRTGQRFSLLDSLRALLDRFLPPTPPPPPMSADPRKMPKGAFNIQDVGHQWVTFDLVVGGRPRKFLFYSVGWSQSITELHDS